MARSYLAMACIVIAAAYVPILLAPVLVLLSWPIAALVAAVRGEFVAPWSRPFAHLSAWHAIRSTLTLKSIVRGIVLVAVFAGLGAAIAAALIMIPPGETTAAVEGAAFLLLGLGGLIAAFVPTFLDWRWYLRRLRNPPDAITYVELLTYFEEQRTLPGLLRTARVVRDDQLLLPDADSERAVRELLGLSRINPKEIAAQVADGRFDYALIWGWLRDQKKRKLKLIATGGVDLRDELGPALRSLRNRRRDGADVD